MRGEESVAMGSQRADGNAQGGPEQLIVNGPNEAERLLEQLASVHPTYADIRYRLGLLQLSRGRHADAAREFEEALGIHPGYRQALGALRLAHMLEGKDPAPEMEMLEPSDSATEPDWVIVDRAYAREMSGSDPLEAFRGLEGSALRLHYAAAFAARRHDGAGVERLLREAARTHPASGERMRIAGISCAPDGENSAGDLGGLLWSPLAADLYAFLGKIYARNGLQQEADAHYARAYLVSPDEARHARHQAELAIARGEEERAIELLLSAVERDPRCAETRVALAFEYAAQGFPDEARTQFEVAANLAPGYADIRYNLGLLYAAEGRHDDALRQFRLALGLNPGYLPARRSLAGLLLRIGRPEEALREGERILRQGHASADLFVQMARACLALERDDEALDFLLRGQAQNADHAPVWYWLGQVYRRKRQRNKARSAWRRYLEKTGQWDPSSVGTEAAALDACFVRGEGEPQKRQPPREGPDGEAWAG